MNMVKTLNTMENYYDIVNKIIYTEVQNRDLYRYLVELFTKKGFGGEKIGGIFSHTISVSTLSNVELIAFGEGCYEVLKDPEFNNENLQKYFSDKDFINYKTAKFKNDEIITQMFFPYMRRVDNFTFIGRITYQQIYEYLRNGLLIYNPDSQREPELKNVGTIGGYVTDISLNTNSVVEIGELMFNKDFEENQIILNIRLTEENTDPDYEFIPKLDDVIGDLIITPHTQDVNAKNFTIVEILDGFHRIKGAIYAVEKQLAEDGTWLTGGLDVRIVMKDITEAQRVVRQVFKRSDTNEEHLKSYDIDNSTIVIDALVASSKILDKHVASTYINYMVEQALTYKTILTTAVKEYSELDINSVTVQRLGAKQLASCIDNIILYIKETYYNNDIEYMKKNSQLLDVNMFVGYIAIASEAYKSKFKDFITIADALYLWHNNNTSILHGLELKSKRCQTAKIYNTFKEFVTEVIQHE